MVVKFRQTSHFIVFNFYILLLVYSVVRFLGEHFFFYRPVTVKLYVFSMDKNTYLNTQCVTHTLLWNRSKLIFIETQQRTLFFVQMKNSISIYNLQLFVSQIGFFHFNCDSNIQMFMLLKDESIWIQLLENLGNEKIRCFFCCFFPSYNWWSKFATVGHFLVIYLCY